tara:strand:+ start:832 stop:960 length:129 start_codon:yes stop_codon:yes gene_type:complete
LRVPNSDKKQSADVLAPADVLCLVVMFRQFPATKDIGLIDEK